ncbi:hypothetical protein F4806DRAFT_106902 [Annulohypoxylon nitens]|nr:hypothetical protein F4806DRAFT_106902 [Annulohypoxylon nitens]
MYQLVRSVLKSFMKESGLEPRLLGPHVRKCRIRTKRPCPIDGHSSELQMLSLAKLTSSWISLRTTRTG